jgi:hypothetical protein
MQAHPLAPKSAPQHAVGVALQPGDECRHVRLRRGRAARGGLVDLGIGRDVDKVIGGVVGHRPQRMTQAERTGRRSRDERPDHGGEEDEDPRLVGRPGYTAGRARL